MGMGKFCPRRETITGKVCPTTPSTARTFSSVRAPYAVARASHRRSGGGWNDTMNEELLAALIQRAIIAENHAGAFAYLTFDDFDLEILHDMAKQSALN